MPRFAILLALGLAAPISAIASEGLIYAAVFMCNAVGLTEKMVDACTVLRPDLSGRFASALSTWRERNAKAAANAAQACVAELRRRASTEEEFEKMAAKIKELEQGSIATMQRNVNSEGTALCSQMLAGMESGQSDLDRLISK